jgi:hypothetical protein
MVMFDGQLMTFTIHFNAQPNGIAVEVEDEGPGRVLTAEP